MTQLLRAARRLDAHPIAEAVALALILSLPLTLLALNEAGVR